MLSLGHEPSTKKWKNIYEADLSTSDQQLRPAIIRAQNPAARNWL